MKALVSVSQLALLLAAVVIGAGTAVAQGRGGVIEGRVLDARTGDPLPGATVLIEDSAVTAATDNTGAFRLTGVPPGMHNVLVTYLGRKDQEFSVTVAAGAVARQEIKLEPIVFEELVTVSAEYIRDAQARALNQQKTAPNITNVVSADQIGSFPDPNAAETTQRIPGVSIQRDQGEGRYVIVRGTEPRLNSMMIDGERIPSPDPLIRQVALDVIPADLLQAIEVSKALTPDMDADSIGGSVNLVMKQAPERFRLFGGIGGGYNEQLDSYGQNTFSLTSGRRFMSGRMGAIASVSGSESTRGNQDMEVVYASGNIADFDPRFYQVNRRRVGFTGAFDFKQGDSSLYGVRAVYNRYIDDQENRQRMRQRVTNRRIERELRDRTHIERITSLSFDGKHTAGNAEIDYRVLGAYSDQVDPLTMTTIFRQANVNFLPNVTPTSIDPDNIQTNPQNENLAQSFFNSQLRATNFAKDRDIVGAANLRYPISSGTVNTFLKVGGKFRDKNKGRNRNENTYTTTASLPILNYLDTAADPPPFLDGRYNLLPFISQDLVANIPNQVPTTVTRNFARDAEEFDGTEQTAAAYALVEIYAGAKWFLMPGFRYEHTSADFVGREVLVSPSGAYAGTRPLPSSTSYGVPLPAFHAKYALTPSSNLRAAVTRTLARPNYYDTVPYRTENEQTSEITLGNPDLQPTKAWNIDVLGEKYFASIGVVSAGVFYKRLQNYIYIFTFDQTIDGSIFHTTQPLNGDSARVFGFEAALQNQLSFLPSPFDGLGIYANYTYSDSNATFPNHAGDTSLPGQSRHVGNVAASYEKRGFSGRISMNFHGSYVDQVGATNLLDRFYDTHKQMDLSFSQRVTRNLRAYVDVINMNDALLRYYQGVTDRPLQEEHYHWWLDFGAKFEF
jgi:TonB-dependent receptor